MPPIRGKHRDIPSLHSKGWGGSAVPFVYTNDIIELILVAGANRFRIRLQLPIAQVAMTEFLQDCYDTTRVLQRFL
jgi:hypothetical protein